MNDVPITPSAPLAAQQHYTRYVTDTLSKLKYLQLWIEDPDAALAYDTGIYEKIEKELVIEAARNYRRLKVAGTKSLVQIHASEGDPRSKMLIPVFKRLLSKLKRFDTARNNLADAFFVGMTVAQISGDWFEAVMPGDTKPRRWWFPIELKDVDKRRMRIEFDPETRRERWTIFDFRRNLWVQLTEKNDWHYLFHRYDTKERSLGYGVGLAQRLVYYWTVKTIAFTTFVQGAERWGYGWVVAEMSSMLGGAGATNLDTYLAKVNTIIEAIEKQREKHVFVHDRDNLSLKVMEPAGSGSEMLLKILDYCDTQFRILLLGSVLPTGGGGDTGSNARAEVEDSSSEALYSYDRAILSESMNHLMAVIRRCNLSNLAAMGAGNIENPVFILQNHKAGNPLERAQIAQLAINMGLELSKRELYEQLEFTPPDPQRPDDVLKPPAPPMMGGNPPDLAADGSGGDPNAAQPPAEAPEPPPPVPGYEEDFPSTPVLPNTQSFSAVLARIAQESNLARMRQSDLVGAESGTNGT